MREKRTTTLEMATLAQIQVMRKRISQKKETVMEDIQAHGKSLNIIKQ